MKMTKPSRRILAVLLAVLMVLLTAGCAGRDPSSSSSSEDETISNPLTDPTVDSSSSEISDPSSSAVEVEDLVDQKTVREKLEEAIKLNPEDVKGWLTVSNTQIDEAVVQGFNNEYYMRRGADGTPGQFYGCFFMDYRNNATSRANLDPNTIVYGHNIGNPVGQKDDPEGPKFAGLLKFADEEFARENPYIVYTTKDDVMIFEIFAAFYTDTKFYYINNKPTNTEYTTILKEAKLRSEHNYDVSVGPTDKIMTLSTCTYKYGTRTDQRFVVMGKLLPVNAPLKQEASLTKNPSPKAPQF